MEPAELPLTRRINQEPTIVLGLNGSELLALSVIAFLFWMPAGLLIAWLLGAWPLGLVIGMLGTLCTVAVLGMVLKRVKRQRPDGYYQQRIRIALRRLGFQSPVIIYAGCWGVHRIRQPNSSLHPPSNRSSHPRRRG